MKKLIISTFVATMLLSTVASADTTIKYGDETITFAGQQPVIINDRTYVPIRDVFEKLGFEVDWDAEDKVVELEKGEIEVDIDTINNSMSISLDDDLGYRRFGFSNRVMNINNRTMLPLRDILEPLGYKLYWDEETKTTNILEVTNNDIVTYDDFDNVYDSSKPQGELSEQEMKWLSNYYMVMSQIYDNYVAIEEKYDGLYYDEVGEEVINNFIDDLHKGFTVKIEELKNVEAPESLKEVEADTILQLKRFEDFFVCVRNAKDEVLMEKATEALKDISTLETKNNATLYNLYKQNNINYKELFNAKFITIAQLLFYAG